MNLGQVHEYLSKYTRKDLSAGSQVHKHSCTDSQTLLDDDTDEDLVTICYILL